MNVKTSERVSGRSPTALRQRAAKRAGLCHDLCGRPRVAGISRCEECRAKVNARNRMHTALNGDRHAHLCARCRVTIVKRKRAQLCLGCSNAVRQAMLYGDDLGRPMPGLGVLSE